MASITPTDPAELPKAYTKPKNLGNPPPGMVHQSREHKIFHLVSEMLLPVRLVREATGMTSKQLTGVLTGKEPVPMECMAKCDKLWDAVELANVNGQTLFPTRDFSTVKVQLLLCYTLLRQRHELEELRASLDAATS